jgi:hypothetical protein
LSAAAGSELRLRRFDIAGPVVYTLAEFTLGVSGSASIGLSLDRSDCFGRSGDDRGFCVDHHVPGSAAHQFLRRRHGLPTLLQRISGLGSSIDKYIYNVAVPMVDYAENRYRITYRIVEAVDRIEDIKHNVIRAALKDMGYDRPLNLAILSDLPGNSGLGSSSAFTVGFLR